MSFGASQECGQLLIQNLVQILKHDAAGAARECERFITQIMRLSGKRCDESLAASK